MPKLDFSDSGMYVNDGQPLPYAPPLDFSDGGMSVNGSVPMSPFRPNQPLSWEEYQALQRAGGRQMAGAPSDPGTTQPEIAPQAPEAGPVTAGSGSGGLGGGMNIAGLRNTLKKYLEKQSGKIDKQQDLADQYGRQVEQENAGQMNLSPLLNLWDGWYGTKLAHGYKAPLTPSERTAEQEKMQDVATKAGQPLASDYLKEYASDNSAMSKYYQLLARSEAQKQKDAANRVPTSFNDDNGNPITLTKQQSTIGQKLWQASLLKGRELNTQDQQNVSKLVRASTAVNLITRVYQSTTPQEMASLGTDMAGLVGNSNVITDTQAAKFIPSNIDNTAAGITQWFLSQPSGKNQQMWLHRWLQEIDQQAMGARQALHSFIKGNSDSAQTLGLHPKVAKSIEQSGHDHLDQGYYNPDAPTVKQQAVRWMLDPKNAKDPNRAAVAAKIQQMKGL